jgi:hypothetical protein
VKEEEKVLNKSKIMKKRMKKGKELLYGFWPPLTTIGFVPKTSERSFWRSFKNGLGSITFDFQENPEGLEVKVFAEIRFDELEDLKNQTSNQLSEREKMLTFSLSDECGYLQGKQFPQKWFLNDGNKIEDLIEEMSDVILDTVVPYLETYSNMERALEYMLENTGSTVHKSLETVSINAVGLAYILGRMDLDDIIAAKTKVLKEKGNSNIDDFLSFVRLIKRQNEVGNYSN